MATIVERINGKGERVYRVQIRRRGAKGLSATFVKRSDAIEWATRQEGKVLEHRYFPERQREEHTLEEALDRFAHEVFPNCRPGTMRVRKVHIRYWKRRLGQLALHRITPDVLAKERASLQEHLAPNTVLSYCEVLRSTLNLAVSPWHWLSTSPYGELRKVPVPKGRVRFLSESERLRLLVACQESISHHLYLAVMVALYTGGRREEVFGLKQQNVDLDRRVVHFLDTKNGESRSVPLSGLVLDLVCSRMAREPGTYLFPGRDTKHGLRDLWNSWTRALRRADIEDFHFHDLRHTYASYLAMSGASLLDIATLLGHKQLSMVQRYAHLTESHTADVVDRMIQKRLDAVP